MRVSSRDVKIITSTLAYKSLRNYGNENSGRWNVVSEKNSGGRNYCDLIDKKREIGVVFCVDVTFDLNRRVRNFPGWEKTLNVERIKGCQGYLRVDQYWFSASLSLSLSLALSFSYSLVRCCFCDSFVKYTPHARLNAYMVHWHTGTQLSTCMATRDRILLVFELWKLKIYCRWGNIDS